MAIAQIKITVEHREILLKNRPDSLYEISPKGTVPVLYIDKNNILEESFDIMLWAINYLNCDWLDIKKKKQIEMIRTNDNEFKYWLDRYKYFDRYPENDKIFYQKKCHMFLNQCNLLLENNRYFFGNKIQLIDVALFPFIRQCAHVDIDWFNKSFKSLTIWLDMFKKSNLFLSVMDKYEIWDQNQKGYFIKYLNNY